MKVITRNSLRDHEEEAGLKESRRHGDDDDDQRELKTLFKTLIPSEFGFCRRPGGNCVQLNYDHSDPSCPAH